MIGRTPVPTLVYRRREHIISLTALPAAVAPSITSRTPPSVVGFNLVTWTADDVSYWAVSDLNSGELETFARLFRDAPP